MRCFNTFVSRVGLMLSSIKHTQTYKGAGHAGGVMGSGGLDTSHPECWNDWLICYSQRCSVLKMHRPSSVLEWFVTSNLLWMRTVRFCCRKKVIGVCFWMILSGDGCGQTPAELETPSTRGFQGVYTRGTDTLLQRTFQQTISENYHFYLSQAVF